MSALIELKQNYVTPFIILTVPLPPADPSPLPPLPADPMPPSYLKGPNMARGG